MGFADHYRSPGSDRPACYQAFTVFDMLRGNWLEIPQDVSASHCPCQYDTATSWTRHACPCEVLIYRVQSPEHEVIQLVAVTTCTTPGSLRPRKETKGIRAVGAKTKYLLLGRGSSLQGATFTLMLILNLVCDN
jgi:hypothetical protein